MVSLRRVIFINFGLTFLFFSNFGNPQKESWWEEAFFLIFAIPEIRKKTKNNCFFVFFEFRESSKRKLVGRCLLLFFFCHPGNSKKTHKKNSKLFLGFFPFFEFWQSSKESWWEESINSKNSKKKKRPYISFRIFRNPRVRILAFSIF